MLDKRRESTVLRVFCSFTPHLSCLDAMPNALFCHMHASSAAEPFTFSATGSLLFDHRGAESVELAAQILTRLDVWITDLCQWEAPEAERAGQLLVRKSFFQDEVDAERCSVLVLLAVQGGIDHAGRKKAVRHLREYKKTIIAMLA